VLWMGVYPESFLAPMRADVGTLLARIERARPAGDAAVTAGRPVAAAADAVHGQTHGQTHGGAHH
jgi:NADH-quinone oxidoreductase subunit M